MNKVIFVVLEDLPQLGIQTWNTIYVGKTMGWLGVLSPVTSFMGAVYGAHLVIYSEYISSQNQEFKDNHVL